MPTTTEPSAQELALIGMTRAQFDALPDSMKQEILASFGTLGTVSVTTHIGPEQKNTVLYTDEQAREAAQQQYLNTTADQLSSVAPKGGALLALSNAVGSSNVAGKIGDAASGAVSAVGSAVSAITSPFGWIKELFSAQLWDRILFVLGGLILMIVGVFFILHKDLPTPV